MLTCSREAEVEQPQPQTTSPPQNVSIILRLRPPRSIIGQLSGEEETVSTFPTSVSIVNPRNSYEKISYTFDRVFDGTSTQTDLFKQVEPFVDKIFHGVNGTIFAYGQTGSGKTHTMMGNTFANGGDGGGEGLIPQSINHIFRRITSQQQQNQESLKFKVFASYIEIYNDKIFDLLVEERTVSGLDIRETFEKNIIVAGLTEVELTCVQDFCKYQNIAISHRSIGATKLNDRSSRSHFIMQIKIESISSSTRSSTSTLSGKLHLIDLAGSEDNKRTGNSGARMIESGAINKSLFDLGQVVESLNKNLPRIPYRNSKITRFLQDSLGGSAMGLMIACIAPGESNLQDTIGTLNFALKAKGVKNVIQVNEQAVVEHIIPPVVTNKRHSVEAVEEMTASSSNFGAKRQRTSDPSSESHHGSSLLRQPPKRVVLNNNNSQSAEFNVLGVAVESSNSLLLSPMIRNRSILNEKTFNRLAGLERKLDVTQPLQTTVSSFSSSSYSSASAAKDMILTTTASPLNILDSCSSKPPLLTSTEPLGIWASRLSPTTRKKCILSFCEAGKILETTGDFENALLNYKFAKGAVADERDASHQYLVEKVQILQHINSRLSVEGGGSGSKKRKEAVANSHDDDEEYQQHQKSSSSSKSSSKKKAAAAVVVVVDYDPAILKKAEQEILAIMNDESLQKSDFKHHLKGIGEKRGAAIIEHRSKLQEGKYEKMADLSEAGLGAALLKNLIDDQYELLLKSI